jgi:formate--tetrahydrofolate ligase
MADYVITEAGFGADLGAEKFLDIKCRMADLHPSAVVIVATIRALKMHGGLDKSELSKEDLVSLEKGFANLRTHVENMQKYGVPVVVAVNKFSSDTDAEVSKLIALTEKLGVKAILSDGWANGGNGVEDLALEITKTVEQVSEFKLLYEDDLSLIDKIKTIAKNIYRACDIEVSDEAKEKLKNYTDNGYGDLPVCIAKTQNSISHDKKLFGAPQGYVLPIRDVRLSAGAGFVVALAGDILTMPGLPKIPAAERINVDEKGIISGVF